MLEFDLRVQSGALAETVAEKQDEALQVKFVALGTIFEIVVIDLAISTN